MSNGKKISKIAIQIVYIIIFVALINTFQYKGLIGFLALVFIIAGMRIYRYRDNFIQGIKTIEGKVWGKPLDKDLWEKDEFKNTKVKVVWRKKDGQ